MSTITTLSLANRIAEIITQNAVTLNKAAQEPLSKAYENDCKTGRYNVMPCEKYVGSRGYQEAAWEVDQVRATLGEFKETPYAPHARDYFLINLNLKPTGNELMLTGKDRIYRITWNIVAFVKAQLTPEEHVLFERLLKEGVL
jgi:hypothetical protein